MTAQFIIDLSRITEKSWRSLSVAIADVLMTAVM